MKRERSDGGSSVSKKKKTEPKADLVRSRNSSARNRMRITLDTPSSRHAMRTPVVPYGGAAAEDGVRVGGALCFLPRRQRRPCSMGKKI